LGGQAAEELVDLVKNSLACRGERHDNYNRWIATCIIQDGKDLAAEMVARGFACAATAFDKQNGWPLSCNPYRTLEQESRREKKGLWADGKGYVPGKSCIR
jgi:endonuclease YncB( thermonuclease family)